MVAAEASNQLSSLSALLAADSEQLGREVLVRVFREMPELAGNEASRSAAHAVIKANLEAFAIVLENDIPAGEIEVPWLSVKLARQQAWADLGLDRVLRGYRLGHAWLWEQLEACARDHVRDASTLAAVVARIGATSFRYVDTVCNRVAEEYEAERAAIAEEATDKRERLVRALTAGDRVDISEAERTLVYRLDGPHLALLIWRDARVAAQHLGPIDDVAAAVTTSLGARRPLLLREGPDLLAAWVATPEVTPAQWAKVAEVLEGGAVAVAAGNVLRGPDGFRESRRLAERARTVALSVCGPGRLVRYDEVALLSLLVSDANAARAFVASELGGLAGSDDISATLRRTLLVLLRSGGPREAADMLFVHRNTVAHRLRRAEDLLGRPVGSRRQEIEAALLIRDWLDRRKGDGD